MRLRVANTLLHETMRAWVSRRVRMAVVWKRRQTESRETLFGLEDSWRRESGSVVGGRNHRGQWKSQQG